MLALNRIWRTRLCPGLCIIAAVALTGCEGVTGPPSEVGDPIATSWVLRWNKIAVDASGLDHTPLEPDEDRTFAHNYGPGRSSRAMAIVHIAMFEAVNAIAGGYESYTRTKPVSGETSLKAAIVQAAHDTLVALYPSHAPTFAEALAKDLDAIPDSLSKEAGIALGRSTAAAILAMRDGDGSDIEDPYQYQEPPGFWRVDPINPDHKPLSPNWGLVKPFVLNSSTQFRAPAPPALDSVEYADAYNEVLDLGGDGIITPTVRTEEESHIGVFWAYDGTPSLCAPPRLYNQVAVTVAMQEGLNVVEMARLLALVNVAMADAGVAIWESKYHYSFWRPVTGIREANPGTGPTGLGDENPMTVGDPTFTPLGAPASNLAGPNFTPPFPAYPSGHAGFGGSLFETLRKYFGTDDIEFTFVSDEFNGETSDNQGNVRPYLPRTFSSFSEAEDENGQSRIYLGIHWAFDKTEGIALGRKVGAFVFEHAFAPVEK